ncbi:MAG TPA: formate/nitrite transporter family protein [Geminicoccaceae bacterium]|nr:formate/nitrite transporter family protein [Geminicoccaceae bacterium]
MRQRLPAAPGSDQPPALPRTLELDAYAPAQIAERVERAGVAKARLPVLETLMLGLLAGAFIAFGGMYFIFVTTDPGLGFGPSRMLGGIAFSLGLMLVVIAGAELFTGNTLIVMAWVDGRVSTRELARNWALVFVANLVGAVGAAALLTLADGLVLGDGRPLETAAAIARAKVALPWDTAFFRGILCNALVCLAVWLSFAARDVTGKILAILLPISAFVALGFEHSIANMFFVPLAMMHGVPGVTLVGFASNLVPVTLGNIVGGAVGVGLVYRVCYGRATPGR